MRLARDREDRENCPLVVVRVTAGEDCGPAPGGAPVGEAARGDVREDGALDAGDELLILRALRGETTLSATQREAADLAPFSVASGEPVGDGAVGVEDLAVLARVLANQDVDGDGLAPGVERGLGLWPLLRDSDGNGVSDGDEDTDQDGLSNRAEALAGTDPASPDSDGDGLVDGEDGAALAPAGVQVSFLHTDHLGSSAVLTDAGGSVVRRIAYGLWGEQRSNLRVGGPETPDPAHRFTGRRFDAATRLADYGARDYDPGLARFVQPDSIVPDVYDPQSLNRYAYVLGDPLGRVDPTGHWSLSGVGGPPPTGKDVEQMAFMQASARRISDSLRRLDQQRLSDLHFLANEQRYLQGQLQRQIQSAQRGTAMVQAVHPVDRQLPAEGSGYYTYGLASHRFGTEGTTGFIQQVGRAWASTHPGQPFGVGDLSLEGGGPMPPHTGLGHQRGAAFDVRPLRSDAERLPVAYGDHRFYDRGATQDLVNLLRTLPRVSIRFNDPLVFGVSAWPGHDNHLHVFVEQ